MCILEKFEFLSLMYIVYASASNNSPSYTHVSSTPDEDNKYFGPNVQQLIAYFAHKKPSIHGPTSF